MVNEIKTVAVIGAGVMGKQIASWTALYDYNLRIYDINPEAMEAMREYIDATSSRKMLRENQNYFEKSPITIIYQKRWRTRTS